MPFYEFRCACGRVVSRRASEPPPPPVCECGSETKRVYKFQLVFSRPGFSPALGRWVESDREYRAELKTLRSQMEDSGVPIRPERFEGDWSDLYVDDGRSDPDRLLWEARQKGPADADFD